MSKKMILVETGFCVGSDLDGPIDDAIKHLEKLRKEGYTHLDWEYYGDHATLNAEKRRLETDEEYAGRLKRESAEAKLREEQERQYYLKLKAKFEES